MKYPIRNVTELRANYWREHPEIECRRNKRGNPLRQNEQPCTTRSAFVAYVDQLARSESISEGLASRATL